MKTTWSRVLLGLLTAACVFLLWSLFGVLTSEDHSAMAWSARVVSGFKDVGTQLSAAMLAVVVTFGKSLLDRLKDIVGADTRPPLDRATNTRMFSRSEVERAIETIKDRNVRLNAQLRTLQQLHGATLEQQQELVRHHHVELLDLRRSETRSLKYRTIVNIVLLAAIWHLLSALLEAVFTLGVQAKVDVFTRIASWPPMNFLQTGLFALGVCLIVAIQYSRYWHISLDDSPSNAARIGFLGAGIPGFVAMLLTTQAIFQAISASNWRPPYLDWPLIYFLFAVRLVVIPVLGMLTALAVWALVHGKAGKEIDRWRVVPASAE